MKSHRTELLSLLTQLNEVQGGNCPDRNCQCDPETGLIWDPVANKCSCKDNEVWDEELGKCKECTPPEVIHDGECKLCSEIDPDWGYDPETGECKKCEPPTISHEVRVVNWRL